MPGARNGCHTMSECVRAYAWICLAYHWHHKRQVSNRCHATSCRCLVPMPDASGSVRAYAFMCLTYHECNEQQISNTCPVHNKLPVCRANAWCRHGCHTMPECAKAHAHMNRAHSNCNQDPSNRSPVGNKLPMPPAMSGARNECHAMSESVREHTCRCITYDQCNNQHKSNRCPIGNMLPAPPPNA
jgi:hypothetical protein